MKALLARWESLIDLLGENDVRLLAVSKYAPDAAVQTLIDAGQVDFGESRAQSLRDRARQWPDCAWHMIGPLQKNKAKYIGRYASVWHSCDNLETAQSVARVIEGGRRLPVLIQVNIADVPHQHGVRPDGLAAFAAALVQIEGLTLIGLMTMAAKDGDARQSFVALRALRDGLLGEVCMPSTLQLCMGMSGDYVTAIDEGAAMVRLGSTLFGDWDVRH